MRLAPLLAALLLAGCAAPLPGRPGDDAPAAANAIVVASHPLAAEAGAQMLRRGGSAVDAALAVQWALTVVEPHFSGIGGGTFLLMYNATAGEVLALDGREVAPAAATADMFLLPTGHEQPFEVAHQMGYAVGVPGTVRLWHEAWTRAGSLPWATTFEPAIAYADEGFPVDAYLAAELANATNQAKLRAWPASAAQFFHDPVCAPALVACVGGLPYAEGETLRQADLADTMRALAAGGPDAFYDGEIAGAIVEATRARQGRMAPADLAGYEVVEREPVRLRLGEEELVSMPPPAGGVIALEFLGIMDGFAQRDHESVDALHLQAEALRRAYSDRVAYLADPAFVDVPTAGLLAPGYLASRRADIDPERATPAEPGRPEGAGRAGTRDNEGLHTSHFVIVDFEGNVVTSTTSIENVFGSGMVVPGHGFLLNNHMTDFDLTPGGINEVAPGKRPRSAQSPTLVLVDGAPVFAVGASGGPRIIAAVGQATLHARQHGTSVAEAVAAARVVPLAFPALRWDGGLAADVRSELEKRGHDLEDAPVDIANVQAAALVDGKWVGAADTRAAMGAVVALEREEQPQSAVSSSSPAMS